MEAAISPVAVSQHWQTRRSSMGKINKICSDVSLTAEQGRGKIRQIDERAEREIARSSRETT
jgi:hypothetical protein